MMNSNWRPVNSYESGRSKKGRKKQDNREKGCGVGENEFQKTIAISFSQERGNKYEEVDK